MDAANGERLHPTPPDSSRLFAPPRDHLLIAADDARTFDLAGRLWEPAPLPASSPIHFEVVTTDGPGPGPEAERALVWTRTARGWDASLADLLALRIDLEAALVQATVSRGLLDGDPALAARTLLEAPAAVLLSRRAWQVLHAGSVTGPRGAVVIRGGPGAGKSTLVAAAWKAGLDILADESLLVARDNMDELAASVRDLTLRADSALLLGLSPRTSAAFSGGEPKRRLDLWTGSSPSSRRARLAAAVLLGDRERAPARLVPLSDRNFVTAFSAGEIPQERDGGDPDRVARAWGARGGFRLDGARDLDGAVAVLARLVQ